MRIFLAKSERRCTNVQQSRVFVKALENTIILYKNSTLPVFEKRCLLYFFKGVNNPSGGAQTEINDDIFGENRASPYIGRAVESFRQSP